jgi:hypothetical protein
MIVAAVSSPGAAEALAITAFVIAVLAAVWIAIDYFHLRRRWGRRKVGSLKALDAPEAIIDELREAELYHLRVFPALRAQLFGAIRIVVQSGHDVPHRN